MPTYEVTDEVADPATDGTVLLSRRLHHHPVPPRGQLVTAVRAGRRPFTCRVVGHTAAYVQRLPAT